MPRLQLSSGPHTPLLQCFVDNGSNVLRVTPTFKVTTCTEPVPGCNRVPAAALCVPPAQECSYLQLERRAPLPSFPVPSPAGACWGLGDIPGSPQPRPLHVRRASGHRRCNSQGEARQGALGGRPRCRHRRGSRVAPLAALAAGRCSRAAGLGSQPSAPRPSRTALYSSTRLQRTVKMKRAFTTSPWP